ncbi:MAG: T9SS type A sorting domain-containing protein [Paludibacter sp.]|nr:T9SS type A sorting domain-containing protein [Paludibacter sp.]
MTKFIIKFALTLVFISVVVTLTDAQTLAFPSAEGYGKYAKGGRGGKVVFVDNLNDYIAYNSMETPIPGSFRWALAQYPGDSITIIFRVSGIIKLKPYLQPSGSTVVNRNEIRCTRAKMTIAGQTAPGEGILIRNSRVNFGGCTDLIVRNVRFRVGENAADSTFLPGGSVDCENAVNVIFDHCNFGWSGEENLTFYDNRYTTIQWSIFHDALYDDGHGKGNRSYGSQTGGICATYHHNLWTNNESRSPRLNGARTTNETNVFIEFINNVVYNWGSTNAAYGGDILNSGTRSHTCNFVNNYYKPGPATPTGSKYFFTNYIYSGASSIPQWYLSGNIMEGSSTINSDNWTGFIWKWSGTAGTTLPTKATASSDILLSPPSSVVYNSAWVGYTPYKISTIQTATDAYNSILANVGTINRDSVERRVIREVKNGTATFKASLGSWGIIDKSYNAEGYRPYANAVAPTDTDNDGMPDDWEIANGLDPNNPDDRNQKTPEGYTALEVYLASLMGDNITHNFVTAINEVKSFNAKVVPTVVNGKFKVIADSPLLSAKVIDLNGKQLLVSSLANNNSIDISNFIKGCYFVQIKNATGATQQFKIIKD